MSVHAVYHYFNLPRPENNYFNCYISLFSNNILKIMSRNSLTVKLNAKYEVRPWLSMQLDIRCPQKITGMNTKASSGVLFPPLRGINSICASNFVSLIFSECHWFDLQASLHLVSEAWVSLQLTNFDLWPRVTFRLLGYTLRFRNCSFGNKSVSLFSLIRKFKSLFNFKDFPFFPISVPAQFICRDIGDLLQNCFTGIAQCSNACSPEKNVF